MRRLIDEYGTTYTVEDEVIDTPCYGEPTKRLYDLATGQAYDLPADLFDDEPAPPSLPPLPERTPAYQEKLVEVLLEKCTLNVKDKERVALLIGPALAIGKITSQEDFTIAMTEVENLIRSLYISNAISEEDSVYLMDQIEFFARWQLRRSVTFDGKPNEREWWTIQSIHQKTEVKGEQPGSGGILGALGRAFGKGKWR